MRLVAIALAAGVAWFVQAVPAPAQTRETALVSRTAPDDVTIRAVRVAEPLVLDGRPSTATGATPGRASAAAS